MRILVCSDIHFFAPSCHPKQLFCKEIIGNLSALFFRKQLFLPSHAEILLNQLSSLEITHALFLGDFTTTSSKKEFAIVQRFISEVQRKKITVFAIPGNHDNYTKEAFEEKRFYQMLEDLIDIKDLAKDKVAAYPLDHKLWLISLDTTLKTPFPHAWGIFSQEIEAKLKKLLDSIPSDHQVIIANHFPLRTNKPAIKALYRKEALEALIARYPQVRFYFCGHDHHYKRLDFSSFKMINLHSLTHKKQGGFLVFEPHKKIEIYRAPDHPKTPFLLKETYDVV